MRDVYQILREKELAILRIRKEIEALRSVAPLLADDGDGTPSAQLPHPPLRAVNRD